MPFDPHQAERIDRILKAAKVPYHSKKMMGGMLFMVDDKMCCGTHIDKKYGDSLLMLRIGEEAYAKEIEKPHCLPMDFTGRPMKGYIFVTPEGCDREEDLEYWIGLALAHNPEVKKKKK